MSLLCCSGAVNLYRQDAGLVKIDPRNMRPAGVQCPALGAPMRAISLSNEPLVISYALRQLIASGELGVVSSGDKAAVLLPMEKYNALMGVLRWLETPARRTAKGRARKSMGRRDEP